jgi:hypothetical protein
MRGSPATLTIPRVLIMRPGTTVITRGVLGIELRSAPL